MHIPVAEKFYRLCPIIITVLLTSTICLSLSNYYHLFTHGFLHTADTDVRYLSSIANTQTYTNCGDSPSTARSRGCSFDLLSFSWQTPECYDEPLISAFLAYPPKPWKFYKNFSATEEISQSVAALGESNLHVTWEYHMVHCTFMWMQMHRAYTERGYIDSHLDSWAHTRHCQVVSLNREYGPDVVNVEGKLRYPECRPVSSPLFPGESVPRILEYDHHHTHP
jgi:hypothetical protein